MEKHIVLFVTFPDADVAKEIVRNLLNDRLVACANISGPIESFFHWKGQINNETEVLAILKTRSELFPELSEKIKKLHPYKVPEIIALPIVAASTEYLDWIDDET